MGFFEKFPYSNAYQLNLDWIIAKLKQFEDSYNTLDPNSFLRKSGGEVIGELKLIENALLNANGRKIVNVPDPTDSKDAANKEYVDFKIGTPEAPGAYLPLAGGAMSGDINMDGHSLQGLGVPESDTDALTVGYGKQIFTSAGYGIGENAAPYLVDSSANNATKGGLWIASQDVPYDGVWFGITIPSISKMVQIAVDTLTNVGVIAVRVFENSAGEWEFINPPLRPGVEYRTVERNNGKPVYVKAMDFGRGAAANSTLTLRFEIGYVNFNMVEYEMILTTASGNQQHLPSFSLYTGAASITSYFDPAQRAIIAYTHTDMSQATLKGVLKFTK